MFNRCTLVIYKYTLCVKNTRILGTGYGNTFTFIYLTILECSETNWNIKAFNPLYLNVFPYIPLFLIHIPIFYRKSMYINIRYRLIEEVGLLAQSTDALLQKLVEAENDLRALQDQRMVLEKDISVKKNSLFIDREKVLPHRTRYPTISQLQGYWEQCCVST